MHVGRTVSEVIGSEELLTQASGLEVAVTHPDTIQHPESQGLCARPLQQAEDLSD